MKKLSFLSNHFRCCPKCCVVHVAEHALRVVCVRGVDRALVLRCRISDVERPKQKREGAHRDLKADLTRELLDLLESELDGGVVRRVVLPVPEERACAARADREVRNQSRCTGWKWEGCAHRG